MGKKRKSGKNGNGEGSIFEQTRRRVRKDGTVRESTRYVAVVTLDGGKRRAMYGKTRKEASDKLTVALRDLQQGLPIPGQRLTLAGYVNDWLANNIKHSRREGTYLRYETACRLHITPVLGKVALAKVGPQQVQKLQTALLAKGLGRNSIDLVRATLSGATAQAVKFGLAVRNPVPLVDPPRSDSAEPQPLRPEQASAFLDAVRGHEFEQLFTLMLATGLRIGEALGLRWHDIDLQRGRLQVRRQLTIIPRKAWQLTAPKSKSGRRTIPLIPAAVDALHAQKARVLRYEAKSLGAWPEHDLVFASPDGGPLVGRRVERVYKQFLTKAGLPTTLTPHSLRHSTAMYLMAMNVPPRVIMEIMGHSSLAMTARYQHVIESVLEDAADRLAQIFPVAAAN